MQPLLAQSFTQFDNPVDIFQSWEVPQLHGLLSMFSSELTNSWQEKEFAVYSDAVSQLKLAWQKTHGTANTLTAWDAVHIWPALVSTEYLNLLEDRRPGALILLAHYCLLLEQSQSLWYMDGCAGRLLSFVCLHLDQKWHHWIEQPLQYISKYS